ncbi:hypothetical protein F442_01158 [Phytophthora nicotianae P10297]|uniref:ZSWIM1/3 RNaseH-like domain-containing protein n=2 Tax=Phytophthora nicotianae TaxID=4792 RepID=V9FZF7_PHYNI|nr:hypothetical protein F443_01224 [Phytophthora nicotianae P1569]ETP53998.1 hypothetical protein F442_01158 [Phytophthora nicotianae P10297]
MSSTSSPVPPETTANAVSGARTSLEIALITFEGEFASWEEFGKVFDRTSNSVRDRNRETQKRAARIGKEPDLYDELSSIMQERLSVHMGGSKRKKFLHYLKEVSGKPLQPKDVEDMIAEMRRETYTSSDDNVRVSQLLQDFGEGPGNAVRIFRDPATSLTSCITFQTAHMRRMARKFPEALCIDATHGTNCNRCETDEVYL